MGEVPNDEVEPLQEDEKRRTLESVAASYVALKRFIAEYDRLKVERDNFAQKVTGALNENEMLLKEIKHVKGQRDHLSKTLSTVTAQLDTLASRFIEVAKGARLQTYGERPAGAVERRPAGDLDQARSPPEPNIPSFLREPPEEFQWGLTKPGGPTEKRTLADHLKTFKVI